MTAVTPLPQPDLLDRGSRTLARPRDIRTFYIPGDGWGYNDTSPLMSDALLMLLGLVVALLPVLLLFGGFAAIVWLVIRHRASIRTQLKQFYGFAGAPPAGVVRHRCRARFGREFLRVVLAADSQGIYLTLRLRLFSDPEQLFIPWQDAILSDGRYLWRAEKRLKFRQILGFHLDFDRALMDEIIRGTHQKAK